jgi:hypothetical protein
MPDIVPLASLRVIIRWGHGRRETFACLPPDVLVDERVETFSGTPFHRCSSWPNMEFLGDAKAEIGDELHPAGQLQEPCDRSIVRESDPLDPSPSAHAANHML